MTKITGENKRGSISQTIEAPILRTQDNKKTPLDKSLGGHEVRISQTLRSICLDILERYYLYMEKGIPPIKDI